MQFFRRHWYDVGAVVAVVAMIALVLLWGRMEVLQRLLLLNFIALLVHQFEELGWPGGEPAIMNLILRNSTVPDRYPLNQNSAMVVNVIAAYGFYLIPVFFPRVIWLGLAPVLFGLMQLIVHGILTNVKMKTIYNPGLAAVVLGHIPIGVCYIYFIHTQHLAGVWDWVCGVAYLFAVQYFAFVKLTYTWLADRESPYPFSEVEMKRYGVLEKFAKPAAG
jgi:Protein of unknown function with HXXEE motif